MAAIFDDAGLVRDRVDSRVTVCTVLPLLKKSSSGRHDEGQTRDRDRRKVQVEMPKHTRGQFLRIGVQLQDRRAKALSCWQDGGVGACSCTKRLVPQPTKPEAFVFLLR